MFVPFLTEGGGGGLLAQAGTFLPLILIVVVFYFLLIRPENKRKKNLQKMRSELAIGNEVTTIGGINGKVCSINGDEIVIETGADRVRIQVMRWAISTIGVQTTQNT